MRFDIGPNKYQRTCDGRTEGRTERLTEMLYHYRTLHSAAMLTKDKNDVLQAE